MAAIMRLILQLVLTLTLLLLLQCFGGADAFRASPHSSSTSTTARRTTTIKRMIAAPPARRTTAERLPESKWVSGNRRSSRTGLRFVPARTTPRRTQMAAFLPPSGGSGGDKDGLGAVATSVLTLAGITLFFLSPLGGLFVAVFNSILALSILIPVAGFVAFQVWTYLNTVQGDCANCGAPVQVMKDGTPSICLSCGSIVQAKDGKIYLANPNARRDIFVEDENVSPMGGWINGQGNLGGRTETRRTTSSTTIIDVDVKLDDD